MYLLSEVIVSTTKYKNSRRNLNRNGSTVIPVEAVASNSNPPAPLVSLNSSRHIPGWAAISMVEQEYEGYRFMFILQRSWQKLALFVTLDWWFFQILYWFGLKALNSFRKFIIMPYFVRYNKDDLKSWERQIDAFDYDDEMRNMREQVHMMKLPTTPWLDALTTEYDIDNINERQLELKLWTEIEKNLPTYVKMVNSVQSELIDDKYWWWKWLCWILPVQFFATEGKNQWKRVARGYIAMLLATFGIWNQLVIEEFDIVNQFKEYKELVGDAYTHEVSVSDGDNADDIFTKLDNDEKLEFSQYLSATITSRAMLLQILPNLTGAAILAADLSSCPLFTQFDVSFNNRLPPLLATNALEDARTLLLNESGNTSDKPSQAMTYYFATYIFFRNSRLIDFSKKIFLFVIGMAIAKFPHALNCLTPLLLVIILIDGWLNATYVIIMLNRLLFPKESIGTSSVTPGAEIELQSVPPILETDVEGSDDAGGVIVTATNVHPLIFLSGSQECRSPTTTIFVDTLLSPKIDHDISLQPQQMKSFVL